MADLDATDDTSPGDEAAAEVTARPWSDGDLVVLGAVDSTNRYALDAAAAGRPGGFVVVCEHQTAGRGRRGRSWVEPAGGAFLCSVLFRPLVPARYWGLLTVVVAGAAIDAIEELTGASASIKWPNDVIVGGDKVAGILAEVGAPDPDGTTPIVIGIGINLSFPPGWLDQAIGDDERPIGWRASTLEAVTGARVGRDTVLRSFLAGLDRRVGHRPDRSFVAAAVTEARARSATIGQQVRLDLGAKVVSGRAVGISAVGELEVEIDGAVVVFDAADVEHLR